MTEKLLNKENLEFIETKEVFDEILQGIAPSINASAFLTALCAKNATVDEIAAAIISSNESIKNYNLPHNKENIIQNVQINNNSNYFNFALTNDLICAANNLICVHSEFNSAFLKESYFEIIKNIDINYTKETQDLSVFENSNMIYKYLPSNEPYFKYTFELSRNLKFNNILKTIIQLLNPFQAKNIFLALDKKENVEKFAQVLLKLNYTNSIVLSNDYNVPFVSPNNKTYVAEAWKNKIFTYILTPDLLEMKNYDIDELKVENPKHASNILLDILNNKNKGAIYNAVLMNAALALYISKKADSIISGLDLARYTIDSSLAIEKLNQIKNFYNNL